MTQFWFGFISAIALIAVGTIVLSVLVHFRQERKRQVTEAELKAWLNQPEDELLRIYRDRRYAYECMDLEERHRRFVNGENPFLDSIEWPPKQGKKGIH